MLAKEIIAQMPEDIRTHAEKKAIEAGLSLEDFVQQQVTAQLSDEELDAVSGGRTQDAAGGVDTSLIIRADQGPGGTTGGVGISFRF